MKWISKTSSGSLLVAGLENDIGICCIFVIVLMLDLLAN